ncbi:MAG: hypothetical protein R3B48_17365 [Kofleriaceae bacterium]
MLDELAAVAVAFERALAPGQPNTFVWHGETFWVDKARRFVVPQGSMAMVNGGARLLEDTLPADDPEAAELLDIYAGEYQLEDSGSILKMWAGLIAGATSRGLWDLVAAKVINLAIAQPTINPAFRPLFWLSLADDLGPIGDYADNLFKVVGPMIYLLIDYPQRTPSPDEVRRAQLEFLERMFPGSAAGCEQLSETEWAAVCEAQLRLHQDLVDKRFFEPLLERIGALDEPGAGPFP